MARNERSFLLLYEGNERQHIQAGDGEEIKRKSGRVGKLMFGEFVKSRQTVNYSDSMVPEALLVCEDHESGANSRRSYVKPRPIGAGIVPAGPV